ncbi:hypothetical protein JKF63_04946 [Porcisia hertigi]|uniref:Uncharacterized protein n=1 Tax=Porcisia hertigi TaxID=2761500 RepID=A0A836I3S6_9TRYP|nr:hypothetical protein JKF63_04946 [Porcisia hertigi]
MSEDAVRKLPIAASWVHSDLQKLRLRLERATVATQLKELENHRRCVESQLDFVERRTSGKRARIEQLAKELNSLTAELTPELTLLEEGQRIAEGLRNQLHYQKSINRVYSSYTSDLFSKSTANGLGAVDLRISMTCPLSVHGLSLFPSSVANTAPPRSSDVEAFLRRCAPLFQWSEEEQAVKPPFFFDEPCLMERGADGTLTLSEENGNTAAVVCRNAACPYWHRNQLAHVKMIVMVFLDSMRCHLVVDDNLCAVTHATARLARHVYHADSISLVCAFLCEALQTLIATGLYVGLLTDKQPVCAMMSAPVMKAVDAANAAPPRASLLRSTEEIEGWCAVEQQQQRFNSTDSFSLTAAAVAHFQQHPSSLSWRCMLAAVEDAAQRRWLGRQGVELFPSSPELHLQYVLSVLHDGAGVSEVLEVCLASCRTLSAQGAAAIVAGLDCGQYPTSVARHAAYMLARVFVHVAQVDAAAALGFLAPLLNSNGEAGVAALLLPLARQNLTLLMVALRRTGHLHYAQFLPLTAISDIALELSPPDGADPPESGRDALHGALKLVASYKRDHFDAQLVSCCDAALQISVLRTFSHKLVYMERVVEKTVPESPLSQGVLYSEYVTAVAQQQSVYAASLVTDALVRNEGASCVLTFLLRGRLRMWGMSPLPDVQDVLSAFCAANHLSADDLGDPLRLSDAFQVSSFSPSPPVEWVCAYALHVVCGGSEKASAESMWTRMNALPVESLVHDAVAVTFFFHILLQLSGEARNAALFYRTVHRCLSLFLEAHFLSWSALEGSAGDMIGLPHFMSLCIYQEVPLLLGPGADDTFAWRCLVLEVAASLGVLHPLLVSD